MRRLAFVAGAGLVAFGAYELVGATSWASLRAVAVWFGGGVVLHDGVAVPLTLLAGLALTRWVPGAYRGVVQGAAIASAMLTLALLPLLSGQGRTASNPSQQPLPYGRNLLLVLCGMWLLAGLLALRRAVRAHRRTGVAPPLPTA